jgi:hypothetical protein
LEPLRNTWIDKQNNISSNNLYLLNEYQRFIWKVNNKDLVRVIVMTIVNCVSSLKLICIKNNQISISLHLVQAIWHDLFHTIKGFLLRFNLSFSLSAFELLFWNCCFFNSCLLNSCSGTVSSKSCFWKSYLFSKKLNVLSYSEEPWSRG